MSLCPYCENSFEMNDTCSDEFRMWQGLQGPYYTPAVDADGNLSWTNTGGLANPATVNIKGPAGSSFGISGIVATVGDLPASADPGSVWLVGASAPYDGYAYISGSWQAVGQFAIGPQGPQGDPGTPGTPGADGAAAGFGTPTATIDNTTGTATVTVTASGPDTAKVFAFDFKHLKGAKGNPGTNGQGVPTGGTTGQVLAKVSGTDYDTEWVNQSSGTPGTSLPIMDGVAAAGSATAYSREDHVHPSDTSRQAALVSGTNIKTVNGTTLLGAGNIAAIPTGGNTDQVLAKASGSDYDVAWVNQSGGGGALYFTSVAVAATTGDIATITNAAITADHVLARIEWANPSYITTDVTWTSSAGSFVLNGTCGTATTANIVLVEKSN